MTGLPVWPFVLAPAAGYLFALGVLLLTGRREGIAASVGCFLATLAAGWWHISVSRSSTSGIGFVFLPTLAAISGAIALGLGVSRRRQGTLVRAAGIAALLAAAGIPASEIVAGVHTLRLNRGRDADQARRDSAIRGHRAELRALLARVPERRGDTLTTLLRARGGDREFVLSVLEEHGVDPALLDSLAGSPDLGIALQAVRNRAATGSTLARVYRSSPNRNYFLQALAAHANTPPEILREIHQLRPAPISGLEIWFAQNPATPTDVIADIARDSRDPQVIRQLIRHPRVGCSMLQAFAARGIGDLRGDSLLWARIARCAPGGGA